MNLPTTSEMDDFANRGHAWGVPLMRLLWITLGLALAVIVPFAIWGGQFEQWLTLEGSVKMIRSWGSLGGIVVIALLVGDLFLPIPATPVMSAAGYVYGWFAGGLLSSAGSFLAGTVAYGLCRGLGTRGAQKIVSAEELERAGALFARRGAYVVAISRGMPVLPEVIACLAGLTRMPPALFFASLLCGSLPLGFIYAAIGESGIERPLFALSMSALLPVALWFIARKKLSSHSPKR